MDTYPIREHLIAAKLEAKKLNLMDEYKQIDDIAFALLQLDSPPGWNESDEAFFNAPLVDSTAILAFVLAAIKRANDARTDDTTIAQDKDNQILIDIFHDAKNKFTDIDFELIDDEASLAAIFGQSGLDAIRDAEQGKED
jgi:hypothetical protein